MEGSIPDLPLIPSALGNFCALAETKYAGGIGAIWETAHGVILSTLNAPDELYPTLDR